MDVNRAVLHETAAAWCETRGNMPFFEVSAKDALNVDAAFQVRLLLKEVGGIQRKFRGKPNTLLVSRWF